MSEIGENVDLDEVVKGKKRVYVLFYASWCPFSQRFLPIFQRYSKQTPESCICVMMDDRDRLCEEYSIEIFPTVILFEDGKVSRRLDGVPRAGLSEKQLKELLGKS
jgi:thiol-disulfide isomerase/thioredoxin